MRRRGRQEGSYQTHWRWRSVGSVEAERAAAAVRSGRPEEVPDALLRAVTASGEDAVERLRAYRDAGADLVVVYPVAAGDAAASIRGTLRALAPSA